MLQLRDLDHTPEAVFAVIGLAVIEHGGDILDGPFSEHIHVDSHEPCNSCRSVQFLLAD